MSEKNSILDAGIDWITCTARGGERAHELGRRGYNLVEQERYWGNDKKPWSASGFEGYQSGHVQFGLRDSEVVVRAGGVTANENFSTLMEVADNVSRLDLQATVRISGSPADLIKRHFNQFRNAPRSRGGKPSISLLSTHGGPSTLYLGKRISDKFGRIYDKHAESGLDHYKQGVRYEVELKRNEALQTAIQIAALRRPDVAAGCIALEYFSSRGARTAMSSRDFASLSDHPQVQLCRPENRRAGKNPSDAYRRLAWLNRNVRSTLHKLKAVGLEDYALSALGVGELRWQDWQESYSLNPSNTRLEVV